MTTPPLPKIQRVTEGELRRLFNMHYLAKIDAGKIEARVMKGAGRHPSLPAAKVPFCTESQEVSYVDLETNQEVARAHRYLLPDGSVGASGLPDPKRVWIDGIWYRLVKKKHLS